MTAQIQQLTPELTLERINEIPVLIFKSLCRFSSNCITRGAIIKLAT